MKYQTFKPSERLANFVKSFWVLEGDQPYTHYSMADICPELLFHYKGQFDEIFTNGKIEKSFTAGIHGQTHSTRKFNINKAFGIFGVCLYPHAIPIIFGIPASEITNQMPGLNVLLKVEGDELEEKVSSAPDNNERIKILESFMEHKLTLRLKEQLPFFNCLQAIIQKKGVLSVKELSQKHFLSERQFERQFLKFSGFAPKLFSRIVRFQSAMAQYGNNEKSLTEIAFETGYYDQSHFIHDFKEFSGHLPKEYFSGNSSATQWRD